ncbi:hypothetical protein [Microbulbifer spongiae]|uniref:Uncharacterized protein n=1 Tax=Microbulbifer spongiae TaxID=2944933 RepID=A0ABY9EBX4_9GAMM|nr:hypothetical protein [Microbulbifer sp. MI-G]WKD48276.1 hypothetical protein M8T91_10030 [Microbulbifer sp. MI-G]
MIQYDKLSVAQNAVLKTTVLFTLKQHQNRRALGIKLSSIALFVGDRIDLLGIIATPS